MISQDCKNECANYISWINHTHNAIFLSTIFIFIHWKENIKTLALQYLLFVYYVFLKHSNYYRNNSSLFRINFISIKDDKMIILVSIIKINRFENWLFMSMQFINTWICVFVRDNIRSSVAISAVSLNNGSRFSTPNYIYSNRKSKSYV